MRVENQKNTRLWEDSSKSSLCPETSTKNAVQEFNLWLPWSMPSWTLFFPNPLVSWNRPCHAMHRGWHVQFIDLSLQLYHGRIWRTSHCRLFCMDCYATVGGGVAAPSPSTYTHSLADSETINAKTTVLCSPDSSMMFIFAIYCALFSTDYS